MQEEAELGKRYRLLLLTVGMVVFINVVFRPQEKNEAERLRILRADADCNIECLDGGANFSHYSDEEECFCEDLAGERWGLGTSGGWWPVEPE